MLDPATGLRRKILIFTEPKDTLEYLQQKITARIGDPAAVVVVHGGIAREARRAAIAAFNSDPVVRVMIANDAAGEGVNLQRGAHLMVNYDLPWNPNRLEQRFGRIHRIGQTEVCHLWNLCAANTREGEVYRRLLEKLEEARAALGGKVYDVLGELFEGHALRDLLVDAIRYGDRPETKAELFRKVDGAVDVDAIEKLVAERKLTSEGMDPQLGREIREQMERAQARRLQPHFIGAFFREAFTMLGGRIAEREKGRFEIPRVPSILKERDRLIGRSDPVLDRYARITFEKNLIAGQPQAELVAPGHPLLEAMVDVVLERFQPLLVARRRAGRRSGRRQRAAPSRLSRTCDPRWRERTRSGEPRAISQRLQFIFLKEDGTAVDGGPAPYLDLPTDHRRGTRARGGRDCRAMAFRDTSKARRSAMRSRILVPQHLDRGEDAPDRRDRQGRARGAGASHARDQLLGRARRTVARGGARRQGAAHQCPECGGDGGAPRRAAAQATERNSTASGRSRRCRPFSRARPW